MDAVAELKVSDRVVAWDVENGGRLGALIVCRPCDGSGWVPVMGAAIGCERCSGSGRVHRPYTLPEEAEPTSGLGAEPASAMLDALDAAVDLMVQRIKVLRRVARIERERIGGGIVSGSEILARERRDGE